MNCNSRYEKNIKKVEYILGVRLLEWQIKTLKELLDCPNKKFMFGRGCGRTILRDAYILMLKLEEIEEDVCNGENV